MGPRFAFCLSSSNSWPCFPPAPHSHSKGSPEQVAATAFHFLFCCLWLTNQTQAGVSQRTDFSPLVVDVRISLVPFFYSQAAGKKKKKKKVGLPLQAAEARGAVALFKCFCQQGWGVNLRFSPSDHWKGGEIWLGSVETGFGFDFNAFLGGSKNLQTKRQKFSLRDGRNGIFEISFETRSWSRLVPSPEQWRTAVF